MEQRIIAEVTYDFDTNTIRRDNNVQLVTSETKDNYYCEAIGTPFKKIREGEVHMHRGCFIPYMSVFKTLLVTEGDFYNGKIKQYIIDNLNAELVEVIKEELKDRIERINEV